MKKKLCGHIKVFGDHGVEFICIREPHDDPRPPEIIQIDHAGPHVVGIVAEADKHRMVVRHPKE